MISSDPMVTGLLAYGWSTVSHVLIVFNIVEVDILSRDQLFSAPCKT